MRKLLTKVATLENDIDELKRVRIELATSGYASASLSSSGGSKSYTRLDISKVSELITQLTKELEQYKNMLATGQSRSTNSIVTVYV
jgi:hypothetical protein